MMKELISKQLVRYLERRGVEHVFGLCGHTNIAVLAELAQSKINFVNTRHEQVAAHIADGYARAKRTTAVVLSHLGPGLTNASTGVANAALDSIPMVVIAGDVPSHYYGKHPHQEVNLHSDAAQSEIYRPFVKRVWRVERPDLFPEILDKAFQLAESGRPGPVLVSVPMDIFSMEVEPPCSTASRTTPRPCTSLRSTRRPPRRSCACWPKPSARSSRRAAV
jgi:acetolactate synthase-1/2/3 large subunit